jgi:hypothetical protein
MVKTNLSEEKFKEKHEKYNRPENCENLTNTKVKPEIWSIKSDLILNPEISECRSWHGDEHVKEYAPHSQNGR